MKTKKIPPGTKYLSLICLLLCVFNLKAQLLRDTSVDTPFGRSGLIPLFGSRWFLSESPDNGLPSSVYLASAFPGTGIATSEREMLFEAPEGGGIPLGTPVREAVVCLILLVVLYGIINRQRNSPK
jgi:hypothetical protein